MATEVNLPALGESVTEGTVTRWLKQVGDEVKVDEPLLEVSTDKVDTEIPSPVAGTLLEIKAEEDDTVEVGAVLAMIGDEGEGGGSDDSGQSEDSGESDDSAGGGEDVEQERAEADSEERDSGGEAPSEQEPAAEEDEESESEQQEEPAAESKPSGGKSEGGGSGTPVTLPALGESVTEGTVTRWLKQVGDEVEVDEPLLEVSTDKVDTEIPSPVAGTLLEIKVEEDETVEVGAELAIVGSGEAAPSDSGEDKSEDQAEEPEPEAGARGRSRGARARGGARAGAGGGAGPGRGALRARARAGEEGGAGPRRGEARPQRAVDVRHPAGPQDGRAARRGPVLHHRNGRRRTDPQAGRPRRRQGHGAAAGGEGRRPAASAPAAAEPSPLRGKTEPLSRLRKVIAKRMVESLQVSAQLTTVVEVDVTPIARLRDSVKADFAAREGVKLSFMPFFAKAAIDALKQHPSLNAAIDTEKGEVTYFDKENLAIAVDTEKGLLTPVIKEAGDLSIAGLARKIADVADRTRTNKITPDELSGGTFTLTNTGSRGALFDTPIINQPQVAILGTGSIVKRPVVIDDPNLGETIAVRSMVFLALTYDHRLVDGADAARYLSEVKQRLEAGQFEV